MKLEAGKWYRVKTWEQMEREFGLNEYGNVDRLLVFTERMERFVSKQPNRMIRFESIDEDGHGVWHYFTFFSEDMLISVEDDLREVLRRLKNED